MDEKIPSNWLRTYNAFVSLQEMTQYIRISYQPDIIIALIMATTLQFFTVYMQCLG